MLVVHPSLPAATVQEFLALARKKPNALLCGSGGVGTPAHFGCELLRLRGNAQLTHVPYKGTGQSINDLLGGQIHSVFASMPVGYPHVRTGRLRALASTSPERSALAPELPTMLEAGVPGFVSESWWGAFAPAGRVDRRDRSGSAIQGALCRARDRAAENVAYGARSVGALGTGDLRPDRERRGNRRPVREFLGDSALKRRTKRQDRLYVPASSFWISALRWSSAVQAQRYARSRYRLCAMFTSCE
jgi:hypothetical protein